MPNVLNEFAGDGVTQTFNFSMTGGYLSRDYVYFFTRPNDDLLNYTPYNDDDVTWLTDFSVRTANPIPVGTTFVILRSTTLDPLVDFQNTSRITEKNLDTATWQSIHIAAETSDTVGRIRVVAAASKQEAADASLNAKLAADNAITAAASAMAASQSAGVAVSTANTAMSVATEAKELIDGAVSGAVVSFNGRAGAVVPATGDYSKEMVGLGQVDNTSDMNKPVSAAVSTALGGKVDKVAGKQLSTEDYSTAEQTKLSGIAAGATANATDANLRDRSTHSGTQGMETITGLSAALDARVVETAATGAALLPSGTTAQRPDPALHPSDLLVRGNTDTGKPEWYNRPLLAWKNLVDEDQLGVLDAKVQTLDTNLQALDADIGFTIIYPNGGSAAAPANVAANSRYVLGNPFPGYYVKCEVQLLRLGKWASPGFDGNLGTATYGAGTSAGHLSGGGADEIIVRTGSAAVMHGLSGVTGGLHPIDENTAITSAPARVLVWKSKGAF